MGELKRGLILLNRLNSEDKKKCTEALVELYTNILFNPEEEKFRVADESYNKDEDSLKQEDIEDGHERIKNELYQLIDDPAVPLYNNAAVSDAFDLLKSKDSAKINRASISNAAVSDALDLFDSKYSTKNNGSSISNGKRLPSEEKNSPVNNAAVSDAFDLSESEEDSAENNRMSVSYGKGLPSEENYLTAKNLGQKNSSSSNSTTMQTPLRLWETVLDNTAYEKVQDENPEMRHVLKGLALLKIVNSEAKRRCIEALIKLYREVLRHPEEQKYRCIDIDNPQFKTEIWQHIGARMIILASGWKLKDTQLILPQITDIKMYLDFLIKNRVVKLDDKAEVVENSVALLKPKAEAVKNGVSFSNTDVASVKPRSLSVKNGAHVSNTDIASMQTKSASFKNSANISSTETVPVMPTESVPLMNSVFNVSNNKVTSAKLETEVKVGARIPYVYAASGQPKAEVVKDGARIAYADTTFVKPKGEVVKDGARIAYADSASEKLKGAVVKDGARISYADTASVKPKGEIVKDGARMSYADTASVKAKGEVVKDGARISYADSASAKPKAEVKKHNIFSDINAASMQCEVYAGEYHNAIKKIQIEENCITDEDDSELDLLESANVGITEGLSLLDELPSKAKRDCIETIIMLFKNVMKNSSGIKHRTVNIKNPKFYDRIWKHYGGRKIMFSSGWKRNGDVLTVDSWDELINSFETIIRNREVMPEEEEWDERTKFFVSSGAKEREEYLREKEFKEKEKEMEELLKDMTEKKEIMEQILAEHRNDRRRRFIVS